MSFIGELSKSRLPESVLNVSCTYSNKFFIMKCIVTVELGQDAHAPIMDNVTTPSLLRNDKCYERKSTYAATQQKLSELT